MSENVEGRTNVPMEAFIKAHCESKNNREVAQKLGITVPSVQTRAANYRKRGIPLKKFPKGGGGANLDIDAAKALVAQLLAAQEEE